MKTKIPFIALLGLWSAACDDTTNDIGIFTEEDNISASTAIYEARTRSLVADSVLSNSNNSYYGFLWAILIILFLNGMIFPLFNQKRIVGTDYGSFIAKVEQGQVTRVTIKNGTSGAL